MYIPKKVRESIDLKPGDEVLVEVRGKELIIRKKRSIVDILMEEPVSKVSVEELREVRDKLSRLLET